MSPLRGSWHACDEVELKRSRNEQAEIHRLHTTSASAIIQRFNQVVDGSATASFWRHETFRATGRLGRRTNSVSDRGIT